MGQPEPLDAPAKDRKWLSLAARAAIVVVVAVMAAAVMVHNNNQTEATFSCNDAWAKVDRISSFQDTLSDYRETLTACATITEWNVGNAAHDKQLTPGATTVANLCAELVVSSPLCTQAIKSS